MAYALHDPARDARNAEATRTFEQMVGLRRAGKVFSFESDQLDEIEFRPELMRNATTVLTQLSQGIRTYYRHPEEIQLQIGMRAAVHRDYAPTVGWETAFPRDPFENRSINGLFVRARFAATPEDLAQRKARNASIASAWERMRQELVGQKLPERERWRRQLKRERLGRREAIVNQVRRDLAAQAAGPESTDDELIRTAHIVGHPLSMWQLNGGKGGLDAVLGFFESPYYQRLPYSEIEAELIAQRIVAGENVKPSDVMDIHNVAAFLPYCTHMVLDRSMINAIRTLNLDERYGTVLLRFRELGDVLDRIERAV
jgi:hypothetical protein